MVHCSQLGSIPAVVVPFQVHGKLKAHEDQLDTEDMITIFKTAMKTGSYGIGRNVYKLLPPEVLTRVDVRNHYLLYLSHFKVCSAIVALVV